MRTFEKFTFESFSFDEESLKASFFYSFNNWLESFEEKIDFNSDLFSIDKKQLDNKIILNNLLFNLHIALWISYYKLFPTNILEIKSWYLDSEQILFWKTFYINWLWEFFIKNDIDPRNLINFKNVWETPDLEKLLQINNYIQNSHNFIEWKTMLLWWGWKDSIVSYSILGENQNLDLFVFWKIDSIKEETASISGENILLVKRQLSNNLFKLNQEWYYNWHVPITWIIAFVTFVTSYLYWYSNIILSNEKSASEENTIWKWIKINHQYSKSFEFEKDLNNYLHNYISKWINYFSLLRWMYEYKIAEIFSKEKRFFSKFSSCNKNFVINKQKQDTLWCCKCEKCCFVFLILSPFLDEKELIEIFWENLFDNISLENTFKELIGLESHKPFECVWTYEESLLSANKAINKNFRWVILENIKSEVIIKCSEKKLENKLSKITNEDIIPERFKKLLNEK